MKEYKSPGAGGGIHSEESHLRHPSKSSSPDTMSYYYGNYCGGLGYGLGGFGGLGYGYGSSYGLGGYGANQLTTPDTVCHCSNHYRGLGHGYGGFGGLGFGRGCGSFRRLGYGSDFGAYGLGPGYGSFGYGYNLYPSFFGRYGFSSYY
ncbi:hypothetical protein E5288_WYG015889 [Bos mutus]|uniref:Uncharacterized protein n=2 Tax=Bos TaxID=9903 RepID=A0A6B0RPF9_9CETA|nr:hypothetical protein [Bos mutus]